MSYLEDPNSPQPPRTSPVQTQVHKPSKHCPALQWEEGEKGG